MNALRQFYMEIPVVTRAYTTVCVLTTLAVVSVASPDGVELCREGDVYRLIGELCQLSSIFPLAPGPGVAAAAVL